jgi:hypothetical protein
MLCVAARDLTRPELSGDEVRGREEVDFSARGTPGTQHGTPATQRDAQGTLDLRQKAVP